MKLDIPQEDKELTIYFEAPVIQFIHKEFYVSKESLGWSYTHPEWDGENDERHGFQMTPTGCTDAIDEYWRNHDE